MTKVRMNKRKYLDALAQGKSDEEAIRIANETFINPQAVVNLSERINGNVKYSSDGKTSFDESKMKPITSLANQSNKFKMRIKINDDEIYEIKVAEEIGIQELAGLVSRFSSLLKNFQKYSGIASDEIVVEHKTYQKRTGKTKEDWRFLKTNREAFAELLRNHYRRVSDKDWNALLDKHGLNELFRNRGEVISPTTWRVIELHKITPKDIGLIRFPRRGEKYEDVYL